MLFSLVRIAFAGLSAHHEDVNKGAADYYDCHKIRAIVAACEYIPHLVAAARKVLELDDLTRQQRREIADTLSTRAVAFHLEEQIEVRRDS